MLTNETRSNAQEEKDNKASTRKNLKKPIEETTVSISQLLQFANLLSYVLNMVFEGFSG